MNCRRRWQRKKCPRSNWQKTPSRASSVMTRKINAICVRDFERGLEAAKAPMRRWRAARSRPLLGIPLTVKESYNVAGLPTTWGFPAAEEFHAGRGRADDHARQGRRRRHPRQDQCAARRLATGRATTTSTASPTIPAISAARRAARPADRRRRLPRATGRCRSAPISAARCACRPFIAASMRTSRLSRWCRSRGHTPPPLPPLPLDRDLAVIGPMARCAADLSLLLDVIAGPDPLEAGKAYRARTAAAAP